MLYKKTLNLPLEGVVSPLADLVALADDSLKHSLVVPGVDSLQQMLVAPEDDSFEHLLVDQEVQEAFHLDLSLVVHPLMTEVVLVVV